MAGGHAARRCVHARSTPWPGGSLACRIFKGEAIVPGRLAPEGTAPGLEVKITPGKRAYVMRINDVSGLAGMIQPNSRVDILVVIDDRRGSKQVAKLFM